MTPSREIGLSRQAVLIALGLSTVPERFCAAFSEVRPRLRRLQLARELGVHPTALCHSNFKLKPQHLAAAALRLDISLRFLQLGALEEAPTWLQPAQAAVAEMRTLLHCHCQGSTCGRTTCWLPDRVLGQLGVAETWRRIGPTSQRLSRGQLALIHSVLQHRTKAGGEVISVCLSVNEWTQVIDLVLRDRTTSGPRIAARICAHLRTNNCLQR